IGGAGLEAFGEFFYRGWFYENGQGAVFVEILDSEAAFYIHIQNNVFAGGPDAFNFRFKRTVKSAFVYFFPLYKRIFFNFSPEFFGRDEVVIFAVGFVAAAFVARARRYGETQLRINVEQVFYNSGFAGTGGSRK